MLLPTPSRTKGHEHPLDPLERQPGTVGIRVQELDEVGVWRHGQDIAFALELRFVRIGTGDLQGDLAVRTFGEPHLGGGACRQEFERLVGAAAGGRGWHGCGTSGSARLTTDAAILPERGRGRPFA